MTAKERVSVKSLVKFWKSNLEPILFPTLAAPLTQEARVVWLLRKLLPQPEWGGDRKAGFLEVGVLSRME